MVRCWRPLLLRPWRSSLRRPLRRVVDLGHRSRRHRLDLRRDCIRSVRRHLRGQDVDRGLSCAVSDHGSGGFAPRKSDRRRRTTSRCRWTRRAKRLSAPGLSVLARIRACWHRMEHRRNSHPRSLGAWHVYRWRIPPVWREYRRRDHRRLRPRALGRSHRRFDGRSSATAVYDRLLRFLRSRPASGYVGEGGRRIRLRAAVYSECGT